MHMILGFLILSTSICCGEEQRSWQNRHAEGWAWYHDPKKEPEQKKVEEKPQDPIVSLDKAKEELERALAKAILEPTNENVLVYMTLQKKWINQSADFAHIWQRNILGHPELASLTPTSQYGVQIKKGGTMPPIVKHLFKPSQNNIPSFSFMKAAAPFHRHLQKLCRIFHIDITRPLSPCQLMG